MFLSECFLPCQVITQKPNGRWRVGLWRVLKIQYCALCFPLVSYSLFVLAKLQNAKSTPKGVILSLRWNCSLPVWNASFEALIVYKNVQTIRDIAILRFSVLARAIIIKKWGKRWSVAGPRWAVQPSLNYRMSQKVATPFIMHNLGPYTI